MIPQAFRDNRVGTLSGSRQGCETTADVVGGRKHCLQKRKKIIWLNWEGSGLSWIKYLQNHRMQEVGSSGGFGVGSIFSIVANRGLQFGFVLEMALIFQGCSCYCQAALTQPQGLFSSSPHPTSEETGGAQEAGRGHSPDS